MSLIVAARFDTFDEAQGAARQLFTHGYREESVNIFFVNPPGWHDMHPVGGDRAADPAAKRSPLGAGMIGAIGAALGGVVSLMFNAPVIVLILAVMVGAYIGSLLGALIATSAERKPRVPGEQTSLRRSGVLVAVHVGEAGEGEAARVLRDAGGKDVEQAEGRWRNGDWVDFDPREAPVLSEKVPTQPKP